MTQQPTDDEIIAMLDRLGERLNEGYEKIEERQRQGKDVEHWREFWLGLLSEYEALYNQLPRERRLEVLEHERERR
jgi:hypothetical protein